MTQNFDPIQPVQEFPDPLPLRDTGNPGVFNNAAEAFTKRMQTFGGQMNNDFIPKANLITGNINQIMPNLAEVVAVGQNAANIVAVSQNLPAVGAVAGSIVDVSSVAANMADIRAAEGHAADAAASATVAGGYAEDAAESAARAEAVTGATSEATPGAIVARDMAGRTQVEDPEADLDAANKRWTEARIALEIMSLQGGLKTPVRIGLESNLPDPATAAMGDYYVVEDMDISAPGFQGRAWMNTDISITEWQIVIDRVQAPDGENLVLDGDGRMSLSDEVQATLGKVDVVGSVSEAIKAAVADSGALTPNEYKVKYGALTNMTISQAINWNYSNSTAFASVLADDGSVYLLFKPSSGTDWHLVNFAVEGTHITVNSARTCATNPASFSGFCGRQSLCLYNGELHFLYCDSSGYGRLTKLLWDGGVFSFSALAVTSASIFSSGQGIIGVKDNEIIVFADSKPSSEGVVYLYMGAWKPGVSSISVNTLNGATRNSYLFSDGLFLLPNNMLLSATLTAHATFNPSGSGSVWVTQRPGSCLIDVGPMSFRSSGIGGWIANSWSLPDSVFGAIPIPVTTGEGLLMTFSGNFSATKYSVSGMRPGVRGQSSFQAAFELSIASATSGTGVAGRRLCPTVYVPGVGIVLFSTGSGTLPPKLIPVTITE